MRSEGRERDRSQKQWSRQYRQGKVEHTLATQELQFLSAVWAYLMRKRSDMDVDFNWFSDEDTPEYLASRAFECNELLKTAVLQVEKSLLETASAVCGSKSMHPSSLEFELSSKLATLDRASEKQDPEKLLRIAQSQFDQSRLDEACISLHGAMTNMQEKERGRDPSLDSSVSLPGSSDALSGNMKLSMDSLHKMIVQTLNKSLLDAVNQKHIADMKKSIQNLFVILPHSQVTTMVGQQFWLKIKNLCDGYSLTDISSICSMIEIDASNILESFASLHLQVTWKETVEEAIISPLCNLIGELIRGVSFPSLLITTQNLASCIYTASADNGRLIDVQEVTISLWKAQRLWVRSKIVYLLSEQFRDLTVNDIPAVADQGKAESLDSMKDRDSERESLNAAGGKSEEFALICKAYLISLETSLVDAMHDGISAAYQAAANATLIHCALGMFGEYRFQKNLSTGMAAMKNPLPAPQRTLYLGYKKRKVTSADCDAQEYLTETSQALVNVYRAIVPSRSNMVQYFVDVNYIEMVLVLSAHLPKMTMTIGCCLPCTASFFERSPSSRRLLWVKLPTALARDSSEQVESPPAAFPPDGPAVNRSADFGMPLKSVKSNSASEMELASPTKTSSERERQITSNLYTLVDGTRISFSSKQVSFSEVTTFSLVLVLSFLVIKIDLQCLGKSKEDTIHLLAGIVQQRPELDTALFPPLDEPDLSHVQVINSWLEGLHG
eukprot:761718-Hanusia_phi.AAC.1